MDLVALYDIFENGFSWNNVTALVLGAASAVILATPVVGEEAEVLSLVVSGATLTNDVAGVVINKGK